MVPPLPPSPLLWWQWGGGAAIPIVVISPLSSQLPFLWWYPLHLHGSGGGGIGGALSALIVIMVAPMSAITWGVGGALPWLVGWCPYCPCCGGFGGAFTTTLIIIVVTLGAGGWCPLVGQWWRCWWQGSVNE